MLRAVHAAAQTSCRIVFAKKETATPAVELMLLVGGGTKPLAVAIPPILGAGQFRRERDHRQPAVSSQGLLLSRRSAVGARHDVSTRAYRQTQHSMSSAVLTVQWWLLVDERVRQSTPIRGAYAGTRPAQTCAALWHSSRRSIIATSMPANIAPRSTEPAECRASSRRSDRPSRLSVTRLD